MNETNVKQAVRDHYAAIADQGTQGCCAPSESCCTPTATIQIGDSPLIQSADLGLSCGLPTDIAGIQPGETILDLGSGAGVDVFRAAKLTGPQGRAIGVDMTPEMIARAEDNARRAGIDNVEFRLGEIEALPVEDASVDVVLSNCVINLAPDKGNVFREIYRVLHPGGRFSISDMVTFGQVPEAVRSDLTLWSSCIAGAVDQEEYLMLISASGFESVEVAKFAPYQTETEAYGIASITVLGRKPR